MTKNEWKTIEELKIQPKSFLPQDIQLVTQHFAKHFIFESQSLNPKLSVKEKWMLINRLQKRSQTPSLLQNELALILNPSMEDRQRELENIQNRLIPNPCVNQEVDLMEPISIEQIQLSKQIIHQKINSLKDENAIYHVVNAIAKDNGLQFMIFDSQQQRNNPDFYNKPTDFALENELISQNSFHLLGSEVPEHYVKGFSLHLKESLYDIPTDPKEKLSFTQNVKQKLTQAHSVDPQNITILSYTPGSVKIDYSAKDITPGTVKIDYTVKDLPPDSIKGLEDKFKQQFPNYFKLDIHASFLYLGVDSQSFNTRYNRDFSIDINCPKNEKRGCQPYFPPKGFYRYGLQVNGKYDNGSDTWLGMRNVTDEWCVSYYGTNK
jgi:hypothetical protein